MAQSTVSILNGSGVATSMETFIDAAGINLPAYTVDSSIARYRAAATWTPTATAALTVAALKGSASKTVRVHRIMLGGVATALSSTIFKLIRVSALGAGGTVVTPTVSKMDTTAGAATAVAEVYTTAAKAADTTSEGPLSVFSLFQTTVTTPTVAYNEAQMVYPERGAPGGQSIVLRGTSEILAITNFNGGNLAAGSALTLTIEWTEDAS